MPEPLTPLANYRRHGQQEALAHVVGPATVICHGLASVRLLYFCAVPVAAALLLVNEPSGRAPDLPAETTHAPQTHQKPSLMSFLSEQVSGYAARQPSTPHRSPPYQPADILFAAIKSISRAMETSLAGGWPKVMARGIVPLLGRPGVTCAYAGRGDVQATYVPAGARRVNDSLRGIRWCGAALS